MSTGPALHHAIESFATWLRVERNLSPRTRNAYAWDLGAFHKWISGILGTETVALGAITSDHLQEYLVWLRSERDYKPPTLGRTASCLRTFFRYCAGEQYRPDDPSVLLIRPKPAKKLPIYLGSEELRRLFHSPDRNTSAGRRDYAIIVMLSCCGVRLQELVSLNTIDVDLLRETVRVIGKGSKERIIPLNADVVRAVREMLQDEERVPADGEKALFLNQRGRRLSGRSVQYLIDRHVSDAGIAKKGVSPHKLRHSFATLLHSREVDLVDIQTLLGHASLASTQIYTHTNVTRLRRTIDLLDPEDYQ